MADVQNTDKFLVNRSNQSYQVEAQNLMADIQDTDLMLVNRGGTSYKVTGADVKGSLSPEIVPTTTNVLITEQDPTGDRFKDQSFDVKTTNFSKTTQPVSYAVKAKVTGTLVQKVTSSEIINVEREWTNRYTDWFFATENIGKNNGIGGSSIDNLDWQSCFGNEWYKTQFVRSVANYTFDWNVGLGSGSYITESQLAEAHGYQVERDKRTYQNKIWPPTNAFSYTAVDGAPAGQGGPDRTSTTWIQIPDDWGDGTGRWCYHGSSYGSGNQSQWFARTKEEGEFGLPKKDNNWPTTINNTKAYAYWNESKSGKLKEWRLLGSSGFGTRHYFLAYNGEPLSDHKITLTFADSEGLALLKHGDRILSTDSTETSPLIGVIESVDVANSKIVLTNDGEGYEDIDFMQRFTGITEDPYYPPERMFDGNEETRYNSNLQGPSYQGQTEFLIDFTGINHENEVRCAAWQNVGSGNNYKWSIEYHNGASDTNLPTSTVSLPNFPKQGGLAKIKTQKGWPFAVRWWEFDGFKLTRGHRWRVGARIETEYSNEVENASMSCVFNNNGILVPPHLSTEDPGYQNMATGGTTEETVALQFPSVLSSGESPDAALPPGTSIQAESQCSNALGTGSPVASNILVPVGTGSEPPSNIQKIVKEKWSDKGWGTGWGYFYRDQLSELGPDSWDDCFNKNFTVTGRWETPSNKPTVGCHWILKKDLFPEEYGPYNVKMKTSDYRCCGVNQIIKQSGEGENWLEWTGLPTIDNICWMAGRSNDGGWRLVQNMGIMINDQMLQNDVELILVKGYGSNTYNADDPQELADYNQLKAGFASYANDVAARRADFTSRLTAAGFTEEEQETFGL